MDQFVTAAIIGVQELCRLFKDDENLWIKSMIDGRLRDVLVQHNYEMAFPNKWRRTRTTHNSWIEASRDFAVVKMDHEDIAIMLTEDNWSDLFPNMVAKEETLRVLSPGTSEDNPHGSLRLMYTELQVTSPAVAKRKFIFLRTCQQIDQGTWVVAHISYEPAQNVNGCHSNYRRLPSGCLIQSIAGGSSKVTWVEHMEIEEIVPNHKLYDYLIRSSLAFGAERMVAWLERSCEITSHMNDICLIKTPGIKERVAPWIIEKLCLMEFGQNMIRDLFANMSPNDESWSITGPEELKVYASMYKSSSNYEVVGGAVTFGVTQSPDLVIKILGDERKHHEWDVLTGLRKLTTVTRYLTGDDPRNNVSSSMIEGSSTKLLVREVTINRSGSLVAWSTVSKEVYERISLGKTLPDIPLLISGFSISTDGHTTATNTGGSVITLVLRMWDVGNKPLPEKWPDSVTLITCAINQTVWRVKEALEKQRPPSPRGVWPTENHQVREDDLSTEILQDEL